MSVKVAPNQEARTTSLYTLSGLGPEVHDEAAYLIPLVVVEAGQIIALVPIGEVHHDGILRCIVLDGDEGWFITTQLRHQSYSLFV